MDAPHTRPRDAPLPSHIPFADAPLTIGRRSDGQKTGMTRTALLTGFPGFIGARLIPALLEADERRRIVALVEPRMAQAARAWVDGHAVSDRVQITPGDITQRHLGLDAGTLEHLQAETVEVFHLAAIYNLAVTAALAELVNVTGTEHVLEFCRACPRLERHLYVSTAYVAGLRSGLIREAELSEGQEFKNHYESTKFAAEVLVRKAMDFDGVPTTIVRPAIVVGDSRTGETSKFDGPYYMLRTIAASRGPLMQLGRTDSPFNVVPIDFVIKAIAAAVTDDASAGLTLHLVDPDPLPGAEVYARLAQEYDGRTPSLHVPLGLLDRSLRYGAVRRFYGGTPRQSLRYLNHPVRFDVTNAAEVLSRHGLRCPRFDDYVRPMVRFFVTHEHDPALAPA